MKKYLKSLLSLLIVAFSLSFSSQQAKAAYCTATPSSYSTCCEWIQNVVWDGTAVIKLSSNPGFYVDYSSNTYDILQNLVPGRDYKMEVTVGSVYSSDNVAIWIDWNGDEKFDNTVFDGKAGERYNMSGSGSLRSGTITVPKDANGGKTRMRISLMDGALSNMVACGSDQKNYQYGNIYDFTVSIAMPTAITSDLPTATDYRCTSSGNKSLTLGADGMDLVYQWERSVNGGVSWSVVQASASNTYSVPVASDFNVWQTVVSIPLTKQAQYRCYVYSKSGGGAMYSKTATIQSTQPVSASVPSLIAACPNYSAVFNGSVSGSYTSIQWQKSLDGMSYSNIAGANSATYVIPSVQKSDAGLYRILATNSSTCGGTQIISANLNFQVIEQYVINSKPTPVVIGCVGREPVEFTIKNSGTVYSYQWQKSLDQGATWANVSDNSTANTNQIIYMQPKMEQAGLYRCQILYATCSGNAYDYVGPFEYQVYNSFSINQQPKEQLLCEGETAVLPVVAVGTVYGYKWKKDGKYLTLAENPYANSAILYIENIKHEQSGVYSCEIDADNCSFGRSLNITNEALVYVKRGTHITEINKDTKVPVGGIATISVQAHVSPIPPQMLIGIQWYKGTKALVNSGRIAGAQSSILSIRNVNASDFGDDYWVVINGLCTSDTSSMVSISEAINPTITMTDITNASACEGQNVSFTTTATINIQTNLNYQWRANGAPITDDAKYAGTKSNTLIVNNVSPVDEATKFDVVVTSEDGKVTATSNEASISVNPLAILDSKSDDQIAVDTDKEFTVFVKMNSPLALTYQWYFDDGSGVAQEIVGATTDMLYVTKAQTTDAGTYSVNVKSECDDQTIAVSTVTVTLAVNTDDNTTGVEDLVNGLMITPNPTSDALNIRLNGMEYNLITITNTLGEVIFTTTEQTELLNLDTTKLSLANGTYFVNVIGAKTNTVARFVVNR